MGFRQFSRTVSLLLVDNRRKIGVCFLFLSHSVCARNKMSEIKHQKRIDGVDVEGGGT